MKNFGYLFLLVFLINQCRYKEENTITQFQEKPEVPVSIKKEHQYLLDKIQKLTLIPDSTGFMAIKLNDLMQHHFSEEEDYVLPPLGLLNMLANGKIPEQSHEIILLTEKLKSQLSHMNVEHQMIKAYFDELLQVATMDNRTEIIEFEKEVLKHAIIEEEVFFPTAILIGEYLKLKSNPN